MLLFIDDQSSEGTYTHTCTSHTKNLKNEKGRDGEKLNKQDGMPM